jgi:hypothetical protein
MYFVTFLLTFLAFIILSFFDFYHLHCQLLLTLGFMSSLSMMLASWLACILRVSISFSAFIAISFERSGKGSSYIAMGENCNYSGLKPTCLAVYRVILCCIFERQLYLIVYSLGEMFNFLQM